MTPDVVVVGAGLAGLSAAVKLAGLGYSVVVIEEAPRLGGRASAFTDRDTGERVDNGQHVLFGCYRETYAFLASIGSDVMAPLQTRLSVTMAGSDGRSFDLSCPDVRPPWHLVAGVLTWKALRFRDRWTATALRGFLTAARRTGPAAAAARVSAGQTVAEWLRSEHQSSELCRWLWNPLAVAALNQSPAVAAAAPFARVLAELFGPRVEDSAIGIPVVPLDELYAEPARRFVEARGGVVLTKTRARLVDDAGRITVLAGSDRITPGAVISAVPWHAFERVWERDVPTALLALARQASALESSPIVTVNLWFDGPLTERPFVGFVDGPMHWMFDKSAIFRSGAGHVAVVASGATDIARMDNRALTALAVDALHRALPGSRTRILLRSVTVREQRATFSLAPGSVPRPPNSTAMAGLYLAGDWTDTGLPATIESAVRSGHAAASLAARHLSERTTRAGAGGP